MDLYIWALADEEVCSSQHITLKAWYTYSCFTCITILVRDVIHRWEVDSILLFYWRVECMVRA